MTHQQLHRIRKATGLPWQPQPQRQGDTMNKEAVECIRDVYRHIKQRREAGQMDEFHATLMMERLNEALTLLTSEPLSTCKPLVDVLEPEPGDQEAIDKLGGS